MGTVIGDFAVDCPANEWTRIDRGSFVNISREYTLSSIPAVEFDWRWRGSGLPLQRRGSSTDGVANLTIPPSAAWVLRVNPDSDTTINVNIE